MYACDGSTAQAARGDATPRPGLRPPQRRQDHGQRACASPGKSGATLRDHQKQPFADRLRGGCELPRSPKAARAQEPAATGGERGSKHGPRTTPFAKLHAFRIPSAMGPVTHEAAPSLDVVWERFAGSERTLGPGQGIRDRWRAGRSRYCAWIIRVDSLELTRRVQEVAKVLRGWISPVPAQQFHITLFVAGFP
jgi:hypothetical protein